MSGLYKSLIAIVGLALVLSLAVSLKSWRDLQAARRELLAVTAANEFLKKTLGEMALAISAKDREIDRLAHVGCVEKEKGRDGVPARPDRRKASEFHKSRKLRPAAGRHVAKTRISSETFSKGCRNANAV